MKNGRRFGLRRATVAFFAVVSVAVACPGGAFAKAKPTGTGAQASSRASGTKTSRGNSSGKTTYGKSSSGKSYSSKSSASKSSYSRQRTSRYSRGKWSRQTVRPSAIPAAVVAPTTPPVAVVAPAPVPAAASLPPGPAIVAVAAGGLTSTSARITSDLAAVLDGNGLRLLPMMTRSSLADALALAQVDKADLAFLHADLLASMSDVERAKLAGRIAYVARLYNEEVHVIANRDITAVRDLAGKKVNVGQRGSANAQTAELIFERLGVVPTYVYLDQPTALAQLAAGDIVADVLVSGRPVRALQEFAGEGRFKLLPIPFDAGLQDIYLPAKIESVDYGNLVPPGFSIETVAVPIVLATIDAAPGSPRAARVARFTQTFFDRVEALRDPARHPKWRDVNLAAGVAGWTRFAAAQDMIDRTTARSATTDPSSDSARLLSAPDTRLYGEFLQWKRDKGQ